MFELQDRRLSVEDFIAAVQPLSCHSISLRAHLSSAGHHPSRSENLYSSIRTRPSCVHEHSDDGQVATIGDMALLKAMSALSCGSDVPRSASWRKSSPNSILPSVSKPETLLIPADQAIELHPSRRRSAFDQAEMGSKRARIFA